MKRKITKKILAFVFIITLITMCAACGGNTNSISMSFYISNDTDVTLNSLLLDVEGKPLAEPIEVLSGPLEAWGVQEVTISLPEKQAKKGEWTVLPITEEGAEFSKPFAFGEMYLDEETPLQGFYVKWFEKSKGGNYGAGVCFKSLEEFLDSQKAEE